jgi:hypothetical protein
MKKTLIALSALPGLLVSSPAQVVSDPNEGSRLTHDAVNGAFNLSWWGQTGRTYFIVQSDDLFTWNYVPVIESGVSEVIEWGFTTTAPKLFLRLKYTDVSTADPFADDFDVDGMNNWWEVRAELDPLAASDPAANPDGDEAANLQESLANTSPTDPAPVLTLSSPLGASLVP